ncbi:hypothetical protein M8J75_009981 [Diaphorina citri]|nr:hypothetical protein M8J75_009981 [Diaphorina citri]
MNDSELMLSGSESDSSSPSSCDDSDADPSFNPAGDNRRALFGDDSVRVAHSLSSEDEDDRGLLPVDVPSTSNTIPAATRRSTCTMAIR